MRGAGGGGTPPEGFDSLPNTSNLRGLRHQPQRAARFAFAARLLPALMLAFLALLAPGASSPARGATFTWTGLGATTNWNLAANWSPATVPGLTDIAVFDGTGAKPVVINANISIAGLQVSAAYAGTITQGAGRTVAIGASGWNQAGAAFAGSAAAITVNGPFTLSGGTFTATSGILSVAGDFTHSAGTFAHNGGTLRFIGAAAAIDLPGSLSVWNLGLAQNNLAPKTLAAGDTLVVGGLLTLTNGTWEGGELHAHGDIAATSGFDGGGGILRINGAGNQLLTGTATATAGALPNLVIDKTAGGTLSLAGTIRTLLNWTYDGGLLNAGTSTLILAGTETLTTEGAPLYRLQVRGGTATLSGALTLANELSVLGGTFDLDANSVDVGGTLTVTGTVIADGSDLHVAGNVTATGSLQAGTGRLILDGTVAQQLNLGSSALNDVIVDNSAGASLAADLVVSGTLDLAAGTLAIGSHRLTIAMPIVGTADNLIGGATSSLTVTGTAGGIVVPASVTDLAELAITNPAGAALGDPLTLHAGLVLAGGNLDAGPHLVTIAAGGTVVRSNGHVIGRLQKTIPAGGAVSVGFEIGDALGYTPLQASWQVVTVAGTVTASTSAGDDVAGLTAVGLVPAASVNRTWTLGSSGLVAVPATLMVSYVTGDLDPAADPAALLAAFSQGGVSSLPAVTQRTATTLTMSLAGTPNGIVALAMPGADLGVGLTGPATGFVGQPYSYLVTITNGGPFDASAVTTRITLPAAATRLSATPSQGSCALSGNVLTCDLGPIASAAEADVALVISFSSPAVYRLAAAVTLNGNTIDPTPPNDTATLDVTIGQPMPTPSPSPQAGRGAGRLPDTSTPPGWLLSLVALVALALVALVLIAFGSRLRSATRR